MSSNQTQILDAIELRMKTLLPTHSRLSYSYDLVKNNNRNSQKAWGAGALEGTSFSGVNKSISLDQTFFVVLTENYINRSGDSKEIDALKSIYDNIDTIYADFMMSKLGINSVVLVVDSLVLEEPTKISENVVSVRALFNIKHRKSLT